MYTKIIYGIYALVILGIIFSMVKWTDKNDKAATAYWESQMTECRARGADFDLYKGVCKQVRFDYE